MPASHPYGVNELCLSPSLCASVVACGHDDRRTQDGDGYSETSAHPKTSQALVSVRHASNEQVSNTLGHCPFV
jgi:hypothetical protein